VDHSFCLTSLHPQARFAHFFASGSPKGPA
jgi:hypothetical protein